MLMEWKPMLLCHVSLRTSCDLEMRRKSFQCSAKHPVLYDTWDLIFFEFANFKVTDAVNPAQAQKKNKKPRSCDLCMRDEVEFLFLSFGVCGFCERTLA